MDTLLMLFLRLEGRRLSLDSFFDALSERFVFCILVAVLIIIVVVVVLARCCCKHAWRLLALDSLSQSGTEPLRARRFLCRSTQLARTCEHALNGVIDRQAECMPNPVVSW